MMQTGTSRAILTIAIVAALIGAIGVAANDPHYELPGPIEVIWRSIVIGLAGVSLGFMVRLVQHCRVIRVDPTDNLLRPLGALSLSYLMLTFFVGMHMITLLRYPWISWRTPVAFSAFLISCGSLYTLMRRIGRLVDTAKRTGAICKLTIVDTGKIGPDLDLDKVGKKGK